MGSFSILKQPQEPVYQVDECHINLWSLGGLFGRRTYFFDIGLILTVNDLNSKVDTIRISLPFRTLGDKSEWKDLASTIKSDPQTAQLVFGRPASIFGDLISFRPGVAGNPNPKLPLKLVTVREATQSSEFGPTIWTLKLTEQVTHANTVGANQQVYLRVRFITKNPNRMWTWMNSKSVGIADFRVGDTREILARESGASLDILEKWFVPIRSIRAFLIIPCDLLFRTSSPTVHYIRMFEGKIWHNYLARAVTLFGTRKLMIYQWRNKDDEEINILDGLTEPWKAFIVVSKNVSKPRWQIFAMGLIIVLVALAMFDRFSVDLVVQYITELGLTVYSKLYDHIQSNYGKYGIGFGILFAIFALLKWILKLDPKRLFRQFNLAFNKFENWIYSARTTNSN
jgi:hypothetical protein